jgi:Ca-activated chloride channel family protein
MLMLPHCSNQHVAGSKHTVVEFGFPWIFVALPLPLLVWWLLPPHHRKVSALRVPFFRDMVTATGHEARAGAVILNRRFFQMAAMGLSWALLVTGLAKPEWVGEPIVRTETARDVMLAIDLSGSMDYVDLPDKDGWTARRLDVVQRVVDRFVSEREDDRVGLIVFGSRAYLQLPFTRDVETARALVELMDVAMAGPKTALGDAIGLAIRSFAASQVDKRLLILLTDGNDTASKMTPINAAEIAKLNGVEIHTIGVGDPAARGEDRVDFDTLTAVAQRTGGKFFMAVDESTLADVYRRIDALSPGEVKTQTWRPRESLVHWPAGAAVLLGLIAYPLMLFGARRRRIAT